MYFSLQHLTLIVALIVSVPSAPTVKSAEHGLSSTEAATLKEPLALGRRVFAALRRYSAGQKFPKLYSRDIDLLTRVPTVDLLHAIGYIADSDMPLIQRYRVTIYPVAPNALWKEPVLAIRTDCGQIIFDRRGKVTLQKRPPT